MRTPDDPLAVYVVGTFDTKGEELDFVAARIRDQGVAVVTVDVSTSAACAARLRCLERRGRGGASGRRAGGLQRRARQRGRGDGAGARRLSARACGRGRRRDRRRRLGGCRAALAGAAGVAGGLPKLLVCTLASGDVRAFVGSADIMMLYPVVDVSGLNRISRQVLANAAHAIAGMVRAWQPAPADALPAIGLTMFGVTTPCVQAATALLEADHDCIVFHATGTGGQSMEKLVASGLLTAVLDLTTTEIADELVGGVLSAGPQRLDVFATSGIPYVGSVGALDMVNFWALDDRPVELSPRAGCTATTRRSR